VALTIAIVSSQALRKQLGASSDRRRGQAQRGGDFVGGSSGVEGPSGRCGEGQAQVGGFVSGQRGGEDWMPPDPTPD
jgi:hypothetical protein